MLKLKDSNNIQLKLVFFTITIKGYFTTQWITVKNFISN